MLLRAAAARWVNSWTEGRLQGVSTVSEPWQPLQSPAVGNQGHEDASYQGSSDFHLSCQSDLLVHVLEAHPWMGYLTSFSNVNNAKNNKVIFHPGVLFCTNMLVDLLLSLQKKYTFRLYSFPSKNILECTYSNMLSENHNFSDKNWHIRLTAFQHICFSNNPSCPSVNRRHWYYFFLWTKLEY